MSTNTIQSAYNLKIVSFQQSADQPYQLNIMALNDLYINRKIGSFNFYYKEGYITLLDGTEKEYKQFNSILNYFFKIDPMFGWDSGTVESCKEAANSKIKEEKKQLTKERKEADTNKAQSFLNNLINKDENTINSLEKNLNKTEEELTQLINNTFKNISKKLVAELLNALQVAIEYKKNQIEEEIQANREARKARKEAEKEEDANTSESFLVGQRSFSSYDKAYEYCIVNDFEPELMIIKESANIGTPTQQTSKHTYNDIFHFNNYDVLALSKIEHDKDINKHNEMYYQLKDMDILTGDQLTTLINNNYSFWITIKNNNPFYNKDSYLIELSIRYINKPVTMYINQNVLNSFVAYSDAI